MVELKKLQKEIYENKVNHGFNITDLNTEFCLTYGELGEAYNAWLIDLEEEILNKMEKNKKRIYKKINGVPIKVEG